MKRLLLLALLVVSPTAFAIDPNRSFEDPELQARYDVIIEEVRCLKCQNQNLKDSNAFLASDLRREIRRLLEEGKTDEEIYDFLVARYGEFALYRPRFSGKTLVLWAAPVILLLIGFFFIGRIVMRRMQMPIDDSSAKES